MKFLDIFVIIIFFILIVLFLFPFFQQIHTYRITNYDLTCNKVKIFIENQEPILKYNSSEYFYNDKTESKIYYSEDEILNKILFCKEIGEINNE